MVLLVNNVNVDEASAAVEHTFYMGNGSNTATLHYLNLGNSFAKSVNVMPDKLVLLTKVNGESFTDARSIGVAGMSINLAGKNVGVLDSITVKTTSATTHIEVIAL